MGSSDRDYFRDRPIGRDPMAAWNVVKWLIIANVAIYLLQILITTGQSGPGFGGRVSIFTQWLNLNTPDLFNGQVWRLLTYGFCHDRFGLFHILFNMLFLFWFGRRLEQVFGSREFLTFYLTAIVVAGLAYVGLDLLLGASAPTIGASGGVMAVMALYGMRYPDEKIYIWFVLPIKIKWLVIAYFIFDLHPVLLMLTGEQIGTGVAHAAHLGGIIFGFCYWKWDWRLETLLDRIPVGKIKRSRATKPRPIPGMRQRVNLSSKPKTTEKEEAEIDGILDKIRQSGLQSLTEKERKILEKASEDLRGRR